MTQNGINSVNIRSISRGDLRASMRGPRLEIHGKVMDIVGNVVHAVIKGVSLGSVVTIEPADKGKAILAEVVGFRDEKALLIPFSSLTGVSPGCVVASQGMWDLIPVGDHLLGRVVDPFMQSLNEVFDSVPAHPEKLRIENVAPNPMLRTTIEHPFSLGVRAIDGLLTFGEGQRIGVFCGVWCWKKCAHGNDRTRV